MYPSYKSIAKSLLLLCSVSFAHLTFGQSTAIDSILNGFGHLKLGDPKSKFESQITLINGQDTTDKAKYPFDYTYSGLRPEPTDPTIVTFRYFMIGFDKNDQLSSLNYVTFYGDHPSMLPVRQERKDYQKLLQYFTEKTGQSGTKVIYYQHKGKVVHEGYEWTNGDAVLKVDHYPNDKKRSSIGITLSKKS
ncbi:MAG: hypothetical protein J7621_08300 [Niastella sp.]|nr:hypothetical protein [Niastella sp.]